MDGCTIREHSGDTNLDHPPRDDIVPDQSSRFANRIVPPLSFSVHLFFSLLSFSPILRSKNRAQRFHSSFQLSDFFCSPLSQQTKNKREELYSRDRLNVYKYICFYM